jgi:hypothetical protein
MMSLEGATEGREASADPRPASVVDGDRRARDHSTRGVCARADGPSGTAVARAGATFASRLNTCSVSGGLGSRARFVVAVALGLVAGAVLAFVVGGALAFVETRAMQTTVNGWSSARQCGQPGNNILVQSGCGQALTAVNIPAEAVYWTRTTDSAGQPLSGENAYVLHFPAGGLPPNDGFWSLTMTDTRARLVANAADRFAVGDRSGLVPNADGSLDISIQAAAPSGNQANWLPAPDGDFMLWMRVYEPGAAILDGTYTPPTVTEVAAGGTGGGTSGAASVPWFRILLAVAIVAVVAGLVVRWRRRGGRQQPGAGAPGSRRGWLARHPHRLAFGLVVLLVVVVATPAYLSVYPSLIYNAWKQEIVNHGIDAGSSSGIPVNTLYTARELASPTAGSVVLTTGANTDTLYVGGWLDLAAGPQVLHVPDTAGRYYSVQLLDPSDGTDFAYVGRRTTGTAAGEFLITGPGWTGTMPGGMQQVSSPNDSVFVIGRVLVNGEADLTSAYDLATQIHVAPLAR